MNRLLKYSLIALTGTTMLVIGTIVYITTALNINNFKPLIAQLITENKQRELRIEGDIKLTLHPKLGINLSGISLSEYGCKKIFASAEQVHLSLSWPALFRKQLIVDQITIRGLKTRLIRFSDGSTNIDDLINSDKKSRQIEFQSSHVHLKNTALIFRDEISQKEFALVNLDLEADHITRYTLNNLRLTAIGRIKELDNNNGKHYFNIAFNMKGARLHNDKLTSSRIDLTGKTIHSEYNWIGKLTLSNIISTASHFKGDLAVIQFASNNNDQNIQINLATSLIGNPSRQQLFLPHLTTILNICTPDILNQCIAGRLSGDLSIDALSEIMRVNTVGTLEDSTFKTALTITNFTQPAFIFNVDIDKLDINQFLLPIPGKINTKKITRNNSDLNRLFNLSFLENLNANGLIHIGILQTGNIKSSGIQFKIQSDSMPK
ncbi:AsmA family protein [Nitrosomonas cryotolerans]|nr:AsmA family protein [Nitrosomonas cryotolerans]